MTFRFVDDRPLRPEDVAEISRVAREAYGSGRAVVQQQLLASGRRHVRVIDSSDRTVTSEDEVRVRATRLVDLLGALGYHARVTAVDESLWCDVEVGGRLPAHEE